MRLEFFAVAVGLVNLLVVLEFVRRRKLTEGFALLFSAIAVGGLVLILARRWIDRFASVVGAVAGISVVFFFAFLVLVILTLYLAVHITSLQDRVERLTEELAMLRGIEPPLADGTDPGSDRAPSAPEGDVPPDR